MSSLGVEILRKHRAQQAKHRLAIGPAWQSMDLVVTTSDGALINPSNSHRHFKKILRKANLPNIRFHDLRHTHATLMLQQGEHPKVVSERLGHSSIQITLDTYSHALPNLQAEAAQRLDKLMVEHEDKLHDG